MPETKLALKDGDAQLTMDARGNLVRVEPVPPAVSQAMRQQRIPRPTVLARLDLGERSRVRGSEEPGAFTVLSPVGQVVATDRPTFTWRPAEGATAYRVSVYDITRGNAGAEPRKVAGTPEEGVKETRWAPAQALPRGRLYQWQVIALQNGEETAMAPRPPAPPARFQVAPEATARQLERYAGAPLVRGVLAAQAGLLDEAEQAFQDVLKQNPDSAVARKLLADVRALRRPQE
jgi:hypothetical protein